jgi:uncharacterized protein (TIGR02246 family)
LARCTPSAKLADDRIQKEMAMTRRYAVALCAVLISTPALAQTAAGEIDAANQRFEAAFNRGDASAVAEFYAEDATVLPPEADLVSGRDAIRKFWQGPIDAGVKNLSLKAIRVDELGGDAAREIGRFGFDAPDPQGRTARVDGKYVVLWRKAAGGGWKLDTDIWNTSKPPPAVATGGSGPPAASSGSSAPPR